MALTGTVGRIVKEYLPNRQAALRTHADGFAAMRAQTEDPFLRVLLWLAEYGCRFLAGLIAGGLRLPSDTRLLYSDVASDCLRLGNGHVYIRLTGALCSDIMAMLIN